MSGADEPDWMLERLRQMEADGVIFKRSPLDPPLPPVRVEDVASEPPTYEEATAEAHRPNHEPTWEATSDGLGRACSLCGYVASLERHLNRVTRRVNGLTFWVHVLVGVDVFAAYLALALR